MEKRIDFTTGAIVLPFLKFAGPVLLALFLQAMYGAVDLLVVGKFADSTDVSAVSTGSQIMATLTNIISSLCMGMTIFLGQKIGEKRADEGGQIVGSGLALFAVIGCFLTVFIPVIAPGLAMTMHAPAEAFELTTSYIRICGGGIIVIMAYNMIGGVFRGIGDSNTPLITVLIACICNIIGDILLVAVLHMGTKGAAYATVGAQFISVVISYLLISHKELPFTLEKKMIAWNRRIIRRILVLGIPIAVQDLLVGISFLVILAIVNSIGLIASAGIGVAEKVCVFIMLVPMSFMQSMSAFVAQNRGAGKLDRAFRGFRAAVGISFIFGAVMFYTGFFHGDLLSGVFTSDEAVVVAGAEYIKAYAIDCLFTCFLFCFIGFYNGMGYTTFVMAQGILGAFAVRVPVSFLMSRMMPGSLFHIGLATPCSTVLQIVLCFGGLIYISRTKK
ncbi:putative efflux protein, MATE family [[Clostridium] aminophilum]|uniref:Probable multidrug resistance protein NorM n=1 Tax=[Clostridium] aminophilum TaxID=1526 RepID=A0A1I0G6H8_9FIRM|nr:MATE family efflux transporter [[Clostridium] aminophilum]SET66534.1 putative efflux protein, MATE family [[Clostridium] aminophilum]